METSGLIWRIHRVHMGCDTSPCNTDTVTVYCLYWYRAEPGLISATYRTVCKIVRDVIMPKLAQRAIQQPRTGAIRATCANRATKQTLRGYKAASTGLQSSLYGATKQPLRGYKAASSRGRPAASRRGYPAPSCRGHPDVS